MSTLDYGTCLMVLAVAARGSFSLAASEMGVSQPAISQKMRKLEERVGSRLFLRESPVRLTREGEIVLRYASRIVDMLDDAWSDLGNVDALKRVRIGLVDEIARTSLGTVRQLIAMDFGDLTPEMHIGSGSHVLDLYDAGQLDLVVSKRLVGGSRGEVLWCERPRWIGRADPDVATGKTPLALVVRCLPCHLRTAALDCLTHARVPIVIGYECADLSSVEAVLRAGLGVYPSAPGVVDAFLDKSCDLPGLPDLPFEECFLEVRRATVSRSYIRVLGKAVGDALRVRAGNAAAVEA